MVTRRSMSLGLGAFSAALAPEKEDFRGDFELHEFITDAFSGSVFMRSKLYGSAYIREYLSRSKICAEDQAPCTTARCLTPFTTGAPPVDH